MAKNKKSKRKVDQIIVSKSGKIKKKKEKSIIIDVLGTEYTLRVPIDEKELDDYKADGLCDDLLKDIQIRDLRDSTINKKAALIDMKHNIRHECLHAFVKECGLSRNSSSEAAWPVEEACIDFFALQFDKINDVFNQAYQILKQLD